MRRIFTAAVHFLAALTMVAALALLGSGAARAQQKPPAKAEAKSIEGEWEGVLGGRLHLIITFSKAGEGTYIGKLNSVDQGAVLPIESAAQQGDAVEFNVGRIGGVYKGKLNSSHDEIHGTWSQSANPTPQPLELRRKSGSRHAAHTSKPFSAPLDVAVPIAPWVFQAAGKWHLVYELHIANLDSTNCSLTRIEVLSADSAHRSLAAFSGTELAGVLAHPGRPDVTDANAIAPGSMAVAFLWVTLDSRDAIPAAIVHRINMRIGDYPEAFQIDAPPLDVIRQPVVVIAPPLRGADWVAVNGPSATSAHRRALIPVNGRAYISQRFATDWVQVNGDGDTHTGDAADNRNYRAYGAEIYAVADATVTEVKDGLQQNVAGINSRAIPINLETVGGNHVILQIGDGLFAFYAHMQPGSIRVKVGDRVTRGQVLGLVGNSGNSTEPHLHFDICNASWILACEGVPFAFTSYLLEGHGESFRPQAGAAGVKREGELPLEFDVVNFGAAER